MYNTDIKTVNKDILTIIRAYISNNYNFDIDGNVDDVLRLANKYGIGLIVGYTLKKNNSFIDYSFIDNALFNSVINYEKQQLVRNNIKDILEKNNIDFIFLKGCTLAKYYREEYLRYSCDIDLIVKKDNYDKTKELLINNGSSLFSSSENELTLKYKNNIHIDLHSMFTQNDNSLESVFNNVTFDYKHELSNEYKYIFSIYHLSKHLKENYISLQFLFDIYYLYNLDLDKRLINDALDKLKLKKLSDVTLELIDCLLNDKDKSKLVEDYLTFLLNVASSEGIENMILSRQRSEGVGIKYIFNRVLPNYKEISRLYPSVKKHKYLLPFYYVKRIIDRFKQGRASKALKEVSVSFNVDNNKANRVNELFDELGL